MTKLSFLWPWIITVPLLMAGFGMGVFFDGSNNPLFGPTFVCLVAFAGAALLPGFKHGWKIPKNPVIIMVVLYWAYLMLALSWSTTFYISLMFCFLLCILPALFLTLILAPQPQKWVEIHTPAIGLVALGFSVWLIIQFTYFYDIYGPRVHHPMLNPNNMAGLLNLFLFPAVGLFFAAKERRYQILAFLASFLIFTGLVLTISRGGWISAGISFAVLAAFACWQKPFPWKKLAILAVAAVGVVFAVNLYGETVLTTPGGVVNIEKLASNVQSVTNRFDLWKSTWEMVKDHPWLGTGLASFYFYFPAYRRHTDLSDGFFAHMDPLQWWAEMGILAPVLFYGVMLAILIRTIKALRAGWGDYQLRLKIMAPFCGMLALVGHTHITFHMYMPAILIPMACLLAYWYIATENAIGDAGQRIHVKIKDTQKWFAYPLTAVILLFLVAWPVQASLGIIYINKVQQNAKAGNKEEAEKYLKIADLVSPNSYGRYHEYEAKMRLAQFWGKADQIPRDELKKLYTETIDYLDKAQARNPAYTSLWDMRARAYFAVDGILLPDGEEKAIALLHKILEKNPLSLDARMGLANIYKLRGENRKALDVLERGIKWPRVRGVPDIQYLQTMANLKKTLGDEEGYHTYMREAVERARRYGYIKE